MEEIKNTQNFTAEQRSSIIINKTEKPKEPKQVDTENSGLDEDGLM